MLTGIATVKYLHRAGGLHGWWVDVVDQECIMHNTGLGTAIFLDFNQNSQFANALGYGVTANRLYEN